MKAELAYQVAKELSNEELERLYAMLQNDISGLPKLNISNIKKKPILTDKDAINYLFKNIFKCNQ